MSWFDQGAKALANLPAGRARVVLLAGVQSPDKIKRFKQQDQAKRKNARWYAKHGAAWAALNKTERAEYLAKWERDNRATRREYLNGKQRQYRAAAVA